MLGAVRISAGIGCVAVTMDPPIATMPPQYFATIDQAAGYATGIAAGAGWRLVDETGHLTSDECSMLVAVQTAANLARESR